MAVEVASDKVEYSKLTATGRNCDALQEVLRRYLTKNLHPRIAKKQQD